MAMGLRNSITIWILLLLICQVEGRGYPVKVQSQREHHDCIDIYKEPAFHSPLQKNHSHQISSHKKKTGVIAPKRFVQRVKKENEAFRSYMHQDAHEFLNFLLNVLVDLLEKESKAAKSSPEVDKYSDKVANGTCGPQAIGIHKEPLVTWVHKNFQGILTNETRCLRCETVTARDETFFDLSLDIEQNSSITSCLKNFSSIETLNAEDNFFCNKCCSSIITRDPWPWD